MRVRKHQPATTGVLSAIAWEVWEAIRESQTIKEASMTDLTLGDLVPLVLIMVGGGWTAWLYRVERKAPFDMSINAAIAHVLKHNPSSAISRLDAEMKALQGILKLAKAGKLAMAGSLDEGVPPVRIPRKRMQHLTPRDMVIPRSQEAPEGHVYTLGGPAPQEPREYSRCEVETYTNLLVKSSEFYRLWPRALGPDQER